MILDSSCVADEIALAMLDCADAGVPIRGLTMDELCKRLKRGESMVRRYLDELHRRWPGALVTQKRDSSKRGRRPLEWMLDLVSVGWRERAVRVRSDRQAAHQRMIDASAWRRRGATKGAQPRSHPILRSVDDSQHVSITQRPASRDPWSIAGAPSVRSILGVGDCAGEYVAMLDLAEKAIDYMGVSP